MAAFGTQWIRGLETGLGGALLRGFAVLGCCALLFAAYAWSEFHGLNSAEAMESAQLARNLAEGRGFVTDCARPFDFWFLGRDRARSLALPLPDVRNEPGFPFLLAAGFRLVGPDFDIRPRQRLYIPEIAVVLPTGFACLLLTAALLYLLGRMMFGEGVARVVAVLFVVSEPVLASALQGTRAPLLMLLAVGATYAAAAGARALAESRSAWTWAPALTLAGILCGGLLLTSYACWALVPSSALFIVLASRERRGMALTLYLAAVLVVALPWVFRNVKVCGAPFGSAPYAVLHDTFVAPGDSLAREPKPDLRNEHVAWSVQNKLAANLAGALDDGLAVAGGVLIVGLFLIGLFLPAVSDEARAMQWATVSGLVLLLLATALGEGIRPAVLLALTPLVILLATGTLAAVLDRRDDMHPEMQTVALWAVAAVCALPLVLRIMGPPQGNPYPPYHPALNAYAAHLAGPNQAVATDIPWATAWYGRHASVLIPTTPESLGALTNRTPSIGGVYLAGVSPVDRPWQPLLHGQVPDGFAFPLGIHLPPGSRDQLFLCATNR
jgi:hypothetical protein